METWRCRRTFASATSRCLQRVLAFPCRFEGPLLGAQSARVDFRFGSTGAHHTTGKQSFHTPGQAHIAAKGRPLDRPPGALTTASAIRKFPPRNGKLPLGTGNFPPGGGSMPHAGANLPLGAATFPRRDGNFPGGTGNLLLGEASMPKRAPTMPRRAGNFPLETPTLPLARATRRRRADRGRVLPGRRSQVHEGSWSTPWL